MDKPSLSKYILNRLSAAAGRDDVIREACQRGNILWPEAEALVKEVEETNAREIERRRSPIGITSSLMVAAFGLLLTSYAVFAMLEPVIGRVMPDVLYGLSDPGNRHGPLYGPSSEPISTSASGEESGIWYAVNRLGASYGVSPDIIGVVYAIAAGYFYWPLLLIGVGSIIVGSMELTKIVMRITGR